MTASERRGRVDRRRRPTPAWTRYWLNGRRRAGRRDGECLDAYFDRYTAAECAPLLALLALAAVDWGWTLAHLGRGIEEANPLLRCAFEEAGALGFSAAKLGITALVGALLMLHLRFRLLRRLLPVALAVYGAVLGLHVATQLA